MRNSFEHSYDASISTSFLRGFLSQPGRTWFAALIEKQPRCGAYRSTRELKDAIRRYLDLNNRHPKPFRTKTVHRIVGIA